MANIMITKRCNLNCEYCFANEFVNSGDSTDILIDDFKRILEFMLSDGTEKRIGLIGGEPTLHRRFGDILDILLSEKRADRVILYTNGILAGEYADKLSDSKFHLLVNCNDIRHKESLNRKFEHSLRILFERLGDRVGLGVNFYKPDFDTGYILELLRKYPCKKLRVSISLPNSDNYDYNPLEYFAEVKPGLFDFFRKLREIGTIPYLDCNILPPCLVTVDEMLEFSKWGESNPFVTVKTEHTGCMPVIDILSDGTAVRCFGLSEYTKTNIKDFASISDLRKYYIRTVDAYAVNSVYDNRCKGCYKFKTAKCSGGCLIYKIDQILKKQAGDNLL